MARLIYIAAYTWTPNLQNQLLSLKQDIGQHCPISLYLQLTEEQYMERLDGVAAALRSAHHNMLSA